MQLIGQYLAYFFDDISWKMEDIGIFAGLKVQNFKCIILIKNTLLNFKILLCSNVHFLFISFMVDCFSTVSFGYKLKRIGGLSRD